MLTGAPREKLPAVIFATFVVFGNQKSLYSAIATGNSAIYAHIVAASSYKILKPRSIPKVEFSTPGVVAGEELKVDSHWGCVSRLGRVVWSRAQLWFSSCTF